jgi:hypothetical protein
MTDRVHGGTPSGPRHRSVEIGTAVAMGVFAAIIIFGSLRVGINWGSEGPKAGFFPFYVGLIILAASAFNLVQAVAVRGDGSLFAQWGQLRQVLAVVIPTAIYVALIPFAGIYLSSAILVAVFMRWLGRYGAAMIAAVAIGIPVAFFLVFEKWFLVPLPKGPIENWLGF